MRAALLLLLIATLAFSSCIPRDGERRQTGAESRAETEAPATESRGGIFGGRRATDSSGTGEPEEEPEEPDKASQPEAGESELPPVELPMGEISQLPEEPHWAKDARIGILTSSRLSSDPQSTRATELAESFLEALLQEEAVTGDFYDPVTAENLTDRLRAECNGVRVGVGEPLPQGEWAVPYRCLLDGDPVPFQGILYITLGEPELVVDGTLDRVQEIGRVEPEAIREQHRPF